MSQAADTYSILYDISYTGINIIFALYYLYGMQVYMDPVTKENTLGLEMCYDSNCKSIIQCYIL